MAGIDLSKTTAGINPEPCPWCSKGLGPVYHSGKCPKVKSVEYYPNGSVKKIEFKEP